MENISPPQSKRYRPSDGIKQGCSAAGGCWRWFGERRCFRCGGSHLRSERFQRNSRSESRESNTRNPTNINPQYNKDGKHCGRTKDITVKCLQSHRVLQAFGRRAPESRCAADTLPDSHAKCEAPVSAKQRFRERHSSGFRGQYFDSFEELGRLSNWRTRLVAYNRFAAAAIVRFRHS